MQPEDSHQTTNKETDTWAELHVTAELCEYSGAPTIFVNGRPIHGGGVAFRDGRYGPPSFGQAEPELVMLFGNRLYVGGDEAKVIDAFRQWFEEAFAPQTSKHCPACS